MKLYIGIVIILFSLTLFSQNADTIIIKKSGINSMTGDSVSNLDTIISETPFGTIVLVGTTKIPTTRNQQNAKSYGFLFDNVDFSPCEKGKSVEKQKTQINSLSITDTTWICNLKIVDNCCYNFLCDISIENDSVLNFLNYGYGVAYCGCNCCFGLVYNLKIDDFLNNLSMVKYVMINNEKSTLKSIESLLHKRSNN
jgi:hypothetical protein